jgi:hypothetical protein
MSRVPVYSFSLVAAGAALALSAYGQAVISTRSGVVHFFEGAVTVAGRPLEAHFGKFTSIPEGAELRTEQGRAEVLLTPGVILRVGEKSAIRLLSNDLSNTRVELVAGTALMESADSVTGTSVTLTYKDWSIRQPHEGSYRVDSDPPRLQVRGGTVEVSTAGAAAPVSVAQGMDMAFANELTPAKSTVDAPDALNDWAEGRAQSVSADNAIAADIQDPASISSSYLPADAFTYFPLLGYPSIGSSLSPYGSPYQPGLYGTMGPYQPGFYSIYLPGYTYRPALLRLPVGGGLSGFGRSPYLPYHPPLRIGVPPASGLPHPPVTRPIAPPPAVHPAVRVGGH